MQCPFCHTENREDRERCYACDKDISMLRLLVNKARHHYNDALEHAERGRTTEAIDELRNALDLDRRFTNAHVVLGTLYAKEGEYEKARECWQNALNLVPELDKAHTYLQRVQAVENTLPALKTTRWIAAGLLVLLIATLVGFGFYLRPDPSVVHLRTAKQLLNEKKYGKALKELSAVRHGSDPSSAVNLAADSLQLALKADLNQQLRQIQELKFSNRYPEALQAIAELEKNQPDNETSAKLSLVRQDIAHYYREDIDKLFLDFRGSQPPADPAPEGAIDYPTLKAQVDKFLNLYPDLPERTYISDYLKLGAEVEAWRQIQRLRWEFAQSHNYASARTRLAELQARFPNSDAIAGGRTDLIDEIYTWMFDEFQRLLNQRQFGEAEALLADIEDTISDFKDVVDVSGPANLERQLLSDARIKAQLDDIDRLIIAKRYEDADLAAFLLETNPDLTAAHRSFLHTLKERINARGSKGAAKPAVVKEAASMETTAAAVLLDDPARHDRFMRLEMSAEDATQTLARLETALTSATKEQKIRRLSEAAAAAAKLQHKDEFTSISARLKKEGADAKTLDAVRKLPTLATKLAGVQVNDVQTSESAPRSSSSRTRRRSGSQ